MGKQGSGNGKGKRRSNPKKQSTKKNDTKTPKMEFAPADLRYPTATYEKVLEHVTDLLQSKVGMRDVIEAIKKGESWDPDKSKDKPELRVSTKPAAADKKREDANFDRIYVEEMILWSTRIRNYQLKEAEAYGIIWSKCSSKMKNLVMSMPDYRSEDAKKQIDQNPILLLDMLKILCLQPAREQHPMITLLYHLRTVMKLRQHDDEELTDYSKRAEQALDILRQENWQTIFGFLCRTTR